MELTPRTLDDAAATATRAAVATRARSGGRRPRRRRWVPWPCWRSCWSALGVLVYKGLTDATLYFRNADEAVAQRDELGTKRFRLQGTVTDDPTRGRRRRQLRGRLQRRRRSRRHDGNPPELFQPGIPVVLEGHWDDGPTTSSTATGSS